MVMGCGPRGGEWAAGLLGEGKGKRRKDKFERKIIIL